jgi:hypothetical protein
VTAVCAPAPSVADVVARHWKDLLGCDEARSGDEFIALGGNSLLATLLANRIEDELGVRPEIAELFTTLALVARHCVDLLGGDAQLAGGRA